MNQETMERHDQLRSQIEELVGDVGCPGTLRWQAADLSAKLGDHGVVLAIDRMTKGKWVPREFWMNYKHFFTHWAVLAIMRLADRDSSSTSIPALVSRLRHLREKGEMRRDRWIERQVEITQWRQAQENEQRAIHEQWIKAGGGMIGWQPGPGEQAALLSEIWNRLTGREEESDGPDDDMEDWILKSAERPLECPEVKTVKKWRNKAVAHQDVRKTVTRRYEEFPMRPIVRAYWAVMKAAHRALLLADGSGLVRLYPVPQFSVAQELSGGKLDQESRDTIEKPLEEHAERWEQLLRQTEERWYRELNARRKGNQGR